jgi:hypothetical protein
LAASPPLTPIAQVDMPLVPMAAAGDGRLVVVHDGFVVFDAVGNEIVRMPVAPAHPDYALVQGDVVFAWQRHGDLPYLLGSLSRATAQEWKAPPGVDLVLPCVAKGPAGKLFVYDQRVLLVVDGAGGTATPVPLSLAKGQHLSRAVAFGDAILVELAGPQGAEYFRVACLDTDGRERWSRPGLHAQVLDGRALYVDDDGLALVDIEGTPAGHVDGIRPNAGMPQSGGSDVFVPLDNGDVMFLSGGRIVRARPSESRLVWVAPTASPSLTWLAHANGVAVTAPSPYAEDRRVWLVDVATGAVTPAGSAAGNVTSVAAIEGRDQAAVACSYTKKLVAFVREDGAKVRRINLAHEAKIFDVVSHAPGAVATLSGERLTFWSDVTLR